MTALACPSCRRALPEAAASGLARELVEALGATPAGLTATELAKRVRRRRTVVEGELERLRARGIVERVHGRPEPRAWSARPWRLSSGAGQSQDEAQSASGPPADLPPALGELGFSAALTAACGTRSAGASYVFLLAAGLFVAGLALEARAIPAARTRRRQA